MSLASSVRRLGAAIWACAALVVALGVSAPCLAQVALVSGTGTGGVQGYAGNASAVATVSLVLTSELAPNNNTDLIIGTTYRTSSGTANTCTDTGATPNTYTPTTGLFNGGGTEGTGRIFVGAITNRLGVAALTTSAITSNVLTIGAISSGTVQIGQLITAAGVGSACTIVSGSGLSWVTTGCTNVTSESMVAAQQITCTWSAATATAKIMGAVAFSGMAASAFDLANTGSGASAAAVSPAVTLGPLNFAPGGTQAVVVGLFSINSGTTGTLGLTPLTSLGSGSVSNTLIMGYEIVSATTTASWTPSSSNAVHYTILLQDFKGLGGASSAANCLLLGVCS